MTGQILARLILFALPLGLDTFALSTVLGMTPMPLRRRVRLALIFAATEGLMPAAGLLMGLPLGHAIGEWSNELAGALIFGVGLWMLLKERHEDDKDGDRDANDGEAAQIVRIAMKGGWAVAGLALSISLDELAVGFSFGVLGFPLAPALAVIAIQALIVSLAGQWVGMHASRTIGERAEHLAGPVLCLLGLWFIVGHLLGAPV
ncbi:MAG TPA: manganese efflux pump [Ktedonobacterales bacterium]|nr:manganese efflux pump [Ktedonobacterales bacterium]